MSEIIMVTGMPEFGVLMVGGILVVLFYALADG